MTSARAPSRALLVVLLLAMAGSWATPQDTPKEPEARYLFSFRFCVAWPLPGEVIPDDLNDFGMAAGPITREQFLDDEEFAKVAAPPGDREVRVSPIYTLICGPERPGVVESGVEGRSWRIEATAEATSDGEVTAMVRYDIDRLDPGSGRTTSSGGKPGYLFRESRDIAVPGPALAEFYGPDGSCWDVIYTMVEQAWP